MKIDKYYVCHYSKLEERREYVMSQVSKYNINLEWILEFDKESIKLEELSKEYPHILKNTQFNRNLSMAEISLVLKHFSIIKDVVKNKYNNVVVFEDDIILVDNFDEKLEMYMNQLPNDYDLLWIGTCCDLHIMNTISNINVYPSERGSRCTHAYVISYAACVKLVNVLSYANDPIDWFYNKAINTLKLKNYWAEPELSTQNLKFDSSINCGTVN